MKLLERPEAPTHQDKTIARYQQAGQAAPETTKGATAQLLALGEQAIAETVSDDPRSTQRALRQKSCE